MTTHNIKSAIDSLNSAQCPHKCVRREGGGNWEWLYFSTEQQAQEVIRWIHGAGNSKFGRARADYNGEHEGLHAVHAHYDNTRRVPHQTNEKAA
jgi:hypothetical protein